MPAANKSFTTSALPSSWDLWAHDKQKYFSNIGDKRWVELHGLPYPIVPVTVAVAPDGAYWGWIDKDGTRPTMIWGTEAQYRVCFPARPEELEQMGRGRTVRLSIVKRSV